MDSTTKLLAVALVMGLSACGKDAPPSEPVAPVEAPAASSAPAELEIAPAEQAKTPGKTQNAGLPFDISTIPLSEAPLEAWPYVAAPEGYEYSESRTLDLAQIPFWTGRALYPVEGKLFESRVRAVGEKSHSRYEVLKRFDEALTGIGAQKITTSEIDREILEQELPRDFGVEFNAGAGGYYGGEEQSVYVLRKPDRTIWFKIYSDSNRGSVMIVESEDAAPASQ